MLRWSRQSYTTRHFHHMLEPLCTAMRSFVSSAGARRAKLGSSLSRILCGLESLEYPPLSGSDPVSSGVCKFFCK